MPADVNKIISANPYHEGGAVSCIPSCAISALSSLSSVHYGNAMDYDARNAIVAHHGKYKGYYLNDSFYNIDVATDAVTGTAGQDTQILYTADAYGAHVINGVAWSYSGGVPTSGNLAVEMPSGTAVFSTYIVGSGQGNINFADPIRGSGNTSMNVRLSAGGSGIVGKLSVFGHRVE